MHHARALLLVGSVLGLSSFLACVGSEPGGSPAGGSSGTGSSSGAGTSSGDSGMSSSSSSGAQASSSGSPDAGPDAESGPRCNHTSDYGNVRKVSGLREKLLIERPAAKQWLDATLSDDERLMLFSACDSATNNGDASCDIYQASLDAAGVVVSVERVANLSDSTKYDRHPTLSADLRRMFFLRNDGIYTASRSDVLGQFPAPSPVASLDNEGAAADSDPFLSRTGALYFMRGPSPAQRSVYYATVAATSITGAVLLAPSLGQGFLLDPVLSGVGTEVEALLFLAKVEGAPPQRIVATAERNGATWSALGSKYVAALNEAGTSNFVNWTSADSCRLYFSRGTSLSGGFEIYVADRAAP